MLSRILVVVGVAAALVGGASVPSEDTDRESKLMPLVNIVRFDNAPCKAASGEHGTCYSQKECNGFGGSASGTCAKGFGVCCVIKATCGDTVTVNNTYIINPPPSSSSSGSHHPHTGYGSPSGYGVMPTTCSVDIHPPYGTCQILLTFEDFELMHPTEGECSNDTWTFHGANIGSNIPILCGGNSGQHLYIDVDNSEGPYKMQVVTSGVSYQRRWKIKVTFIEAHNPCKAPYRCLQYHKGTSGTVSSFNYQSTKPMMLNNLDYTICFAYIPGYCDIGFSFKRFDLGNINNYCENDFIGLNSRMICGDFAAYSTQMNVTGPATLHVRSDSSNEREEEGFYGTYMMMAC